MTRLPHDVADQQLRENFRRIETTLATVVGADALPAGVVAAWSAATAPTGWLLCDGTAVNRVTYSDLFSAIGTTYGTGDGSTTFNVPDLRGRVPVGVDGAAARLAANDTLGAASGTETHTLATGEMPAHSHTPAGGNQFVITDGTLGLAAGAAVAGGQGQVAATSSTGGGGAHNNMQPYQVVNWIIKTVNGTASATTSSAGVAGGDLTGTYPNPSIAVGAVTDAKVTSITTRSKLPSTIVYDDEVNTFALAQTFTLPLLGPNGTAGAPSFTFASDPDTGMYRTTTNSLGFSTSGTNRLTISTTAMTATLATTFNQSVTVTKTLRLGTTVTGATLSPTFPGSEGLIFVDTAAPEIMLPQVTISSVVPMVLVVDATGALSKTSPGLIYPWSAGGGGLYDSINDFDQIAGAWDDGGADQGPAGAAFKLKHKFGIYLLIGAPNSMVGASSANNTWTCTLVGKVGEAERFPYVFIPDGGLAVVPITNFGSGEDDLHAVTVAANEIINSDDAISINAFGTYGSTANNKQIRLYFGATEIFDSGTLTHNNLPWTLTGTIASRGLIDFTSIMTLNVHGVSPVMVITKGIAEDPTTDLQIQLTAEAVANNDITCEAFLATFQPRNEL